MNLAKLFSWSYWFQQPLITAGWAMWFFILTFLGLILLGLVVKIMRLYCPDKWEKEILNRFGNFGISVGLVGLVWFFFRQERVAFFAWRFWLLGWLVWALIWFVKNIIYTTMRVPVIRKEENVRQTKNKYLPNK